MSKNNLQYFVCIAILTRVSSRGLKGDTLVAISCVELVGQSGLPGAAVVLVRIITVRSNVHRRRKVPESQPVEQLLSTGEIVHVEEGEFSIFELFRSFILPGFLVVTMKICDQS